MKIWIKYLLGTILGVIITLFIPMNTEGATQTLSFFTELAIRMGRFFLIPVLFFGTTLAVTNLRIKGKLIKTGLLTALSGIFVTVITVVIGTISALIIDLPRIPIVGEKTLEVITPEISEHILMLFPHNGLDGLFNGTYLLPVVVLAGFIGAGFASDPIRAKQAYQLFDSLNKVSYLIIHFFIEILSIGLIAISCTWFIEFFDVIQAESYTGLIILLATDTVIIVCLILPLLLKLFSRKTNPFKVLYASIAPMVTGLFSGDANLSLAVTIRHTKESLGVKRSTSGLSTPLLSVFVRSGSALIIAVSLIVILKSYSSLEIAFFDVLWIIGFSILSSFLLGGIPVGGAFVAITALCALFGRGFEAGYLLLKPIAFILCSFGTAIDIVSQIFCTYYVAKQNKMVDEKPCKSYI